MAQVFLIREFCMEDEKLIITVNGHNYIMYKSDWEKMRKWRKTKEK